jgi:iron complex transport system permease protein
MSVRLPPRPVLLALGALCVLALGLSLALGAVQVPLREVLAILAAPLGLVLPVAVDPLHAQVVLDLRLPRALLGVLTGAGLAVSGAALQALFRNPLADPALLGVSGGAALFAALGIVLGGAVLGAAPSPLVLPGCAFVGGLLATLAVWRCAQSRGRTLTGVLLLAGIALNALTGAGTGLLTFAASDAQLRSLTFWNLGSLGVATWPVVAGVAPFLLVALVLLVRSAGALNALLLGECEAGHLGLDVKRLTRRTVTCTALAAGAGVAAVGTIGFVGLLAPHLLRLLLGPDHRALLPGAALLGAALLLLSDLVARTVVAPADLPLGIVTALAGAPVFLGLLLRVRAKDVA